VTRNFAFLNVCPGGERAFEMVGLCISEGQQRGKYEGLEDWN